MTPNNIDIFYADQQLCAEWDAQLLANHPQLANQEQPWRTTPGWYWRYLPDPDFGDGPFATRQDCERDAKDFIERGGPDGGKLVTAELTDELQRRGLIPRSSEKKQ